MIKAVTMYKVVCDRCGEDYFYDFGQTSTFPTIKDAEHAVDDEGWLMVGNKHYCLNCFEYNGNNDVYKIKE